MLRGSGLAWDLRLIEAYDNYNLYDFSIPIGFFGDCFDRFLVRIDEMRESLYIISQCLDQLIYLNNIGDFSYNIDDYKLVPPTRSSMKFDMNL